MPDLPTGTVTLLFTDIEGSTHLLQQLGERYADVLSECRQLLRTVFHQWNGHEIDTQGDSFFVVFTRATNAVSAAVDMQRALMNHAWPESVTVPMRMGLHTGEPSRTAEGYVGLDVHHAARIMSVGHGGQVLLSQTTRELVKYDLPEGVSLRDLGEYRLKDLQHPGRLFQLIIEGLSADFPPLKTLDSHPHNLPLQPTPFIGRDKQVDAIRSLLISERVRLLTLTGAGGTGKTRLGLQVAAELIDSFPDGVHFVNLAPLSDPELVVPTIAQALELKEVPGQPLLDLLKAFLREKHLLLLLDNFEQVLAASVQVADLLIACPLLKVVVTSRAVLHVRGEQEYAVPPLAVPDPKDLPDLEALSQYEGVALFIQRAQAVKPEFQVSNANASTVAEICVRLDGLPLAIELAAARIKVLSPQALLARLDQRLAVLTSGTRDAPARQQTLRNTIKWSYDLLDSWEQQLFQRLSVFVGGCTLEAVEALSSELDDEAGHVLDGVASLIDKSLLQQTEQEEPRLVMLELIREYGLERLAASGEMAMCRHAHAGYFLAMAEEAEPGFTGPQQVAWFKRLEREHDNLRAALEWLLDQVGNEETIPSCEMALGLAGALQLHWQVRGHFSEGRTFLERALAGSEGTVTSSRAKALRAAASLALYQGDTDRGKALCDESLALCRELGDTEGNAHTRYLQGLVAWQRHDLAATRSLFEEALVLWREVSDKDGIGSVLFYLAWLASQQGEYTRARVLCEESVTTSRESGNKRGLAYALFKLAQILFHSQGDQASVHSLLEESLSLCRELGDKLGLAECFSLSGQAALQQGDADMARSMVEEGLILYREIGEWQEETGESLAVLGKVAVVQGDYTAARALYEESLASLVKVDTDRVLIASSLEGLADVVAVQGETVWAARLYGAAESLRETMGTPIPLSYRAAYEQTIATVCAQLGEASFASEWTKGRAMTPEQALAAQEWAIVHMPLPAKPVSTPPMKEATSPGGLTTREVEVLRLVAQGLTNEQVAEQLVISPRTVNSHLTSIYSKIQVSSRSAATRYAIEHNFV